jgi:hypothetical protein
LHEGLAVAVHAPHLHFKVNFHPRFATTTHESPYNTA